MLESVRIACNTPTRTHSSLRPATLSLQNHIITLLTAAIHLLYNHTRTPDSIPLPTVDNAIEKCRVCNCFKGPKQTIHHFFCPHAEVSIDFGSLHGYVVSFSLALFKHCRSGLGEAFVSEIQEARAIGIFCLARLRSVAAHFSLPFVTNISN